MAVIYSARSARKVRRMMIRRSKYAQPSERPERIPVGKRKGGHGIGIGSYTMRYARIIPRQQ